MTESAPVDLDRAQLIYAIRYDCVSFLSFYIGSDLSLEVPDLHIDVWNEILRLVEQANVGGVVQGLKKLFAVPRDHAKSTLAKLACILILKYTPLMFLLYTSKTNGIAKNAIRDILYWLESTQETALYGPVRSVKSSETDSLWIIEIAIRDPTTPNAPPRYKRVIMKALGAEQQIRGMLIYNRRPDLIVVDDIEDLDNTTPDQQAKLDEWFLGSFRKSWAKSYLVIFIGNMIRKTTLLARLSKDPLWNPTVYGALVRDERGALRPLWPGRWTVEALLAEYMEFRALGRGYIWEAEMMNLTQDEILMGNLDKAVRPIHPNPEDIEHGFIALDPAFGETMIHDPSAITVHVKIKGVGVPVVIDSHVERMTEDQIFDKMLEFSYTWGLTTWLIESEAAQKLLLSYFNLLMQIRKINQNLFLLIPIGTGKKTKSSRIIVFRNSVSSGSYGIDETQTDLLLKLLEYTVESSEHDDLCDSASYGVKGWELHGDTITLQGTKQVALLAYGDGGIQGDSVEQESTVSSF